MVEKNKSKADVILNNFARNLTFRFLLPFSTTTFSHATTLHAPGPCVEQILTGSKDQSPSVDVSKWGGFGQTT